jgi:pimeloyl-ACP methyl ester carboxylesterase
VEYRLKGVFIIKYININGVKIAYTSAGKGPDIVLLHGWMCNRNFWKYQIDFLSKKYHVIAPDFRGHGDSGVPETGYTVKQLVEDIYGLVASLGLKDVVLVGHSMGGMVAQEFALKYQDCLSSLILVTTIASDEQNTLISKRIVQESSTGEFQPIFLKYFKAWFGEEAPREVIQWVQEQMLTTPHEVGIRLATDYTFFDLRKQLGSIKIPALVIAGNSDASALPDESQILVNLIPKAKLFNIKNIGHFPMLEIPEALNNVILDFLNLQD